MSTRVARQPRVMFGMHVLGAHLVANLEQGRAGCRPAEWPGAAHHVVAVGGGHRPWRFLERRDRVASLQLLWRGDAVFQHHQLERAGPQPIIAEIEILPRRQAFALEAEGVNVPQICDAGYHVEREGMAFPFLVEDRLVLLRDHGPEAVHAAHVRRAVHLRSFGDLGKPVPIMESRVTSSASFSSLQPSVPAGRIGSTMKRVSAVESQTLMFVPVGKVTPKSASTPRG